MGNPTKKELIEVIKYFRDEFEDLWQKTLSMTQVAGLELMAAGLKLTSLHQKIIVGKLK